jgi:hypothetical protein
MRWRVLMLPCTLPTSCERSWGVLPPPDYVVPCIVEVLGKPPPIPSISATGHEPVLRAQILIWHAAIMPIGVARMTLHIE